MKKFLYSLIMMLGISIALVSCDKADNNNTLTGLKGVWLLVEEGEEHNGTYTEYEVRGECIYEFSNNELTIHDDADIMDGSTVEYHVKNNWIWIMGMKWSEIVSLDHSYMKLRLPQIFDDEDDIYTIMLFERIG